MVKSGETFNSNVSTYSYCILKLYFIFIVTLFKNSPCTYPVVGTYLGYNISALATGKVQQLIKSISSGSGRSEIGLHLTSVKPHQPVFDRCASVFHPEIATKIPNF